MAPPEEENFPRGGIVVRKRDRPDTENLFNSKKTTKPKKAKKSKQKELGPVTEEYFQTLLNIRGTLSYNKLQTGMVIMGCVRNITNFSLEIELPGLCFASVNITEISDPFTKYLNKLLEDNDSEANVILTKMFMIGEYLLVKVTNIEANDKGTHVEGTINPRELYSDRNHNSFKKEMLTWSCVVSESDHGYEMTLGIKNCRAFLPFKNTNQGSKYFIGKPLWCVVHKADTTASSSILRVSAKSEHIKNANFDIENLHDVIPGMKVEFVTEKITGHGIQGKFSENFIGYVDENFLSKPLKKLSDYNEGKLLTAYVLFVEPTTKITHLSLRTLEIQEKPDLNVGDIVQAEVLSKSSNGVFFVLPNKLKGFVTNKRLLNTLGKKKDDNVREAVNLKFVVGSKHQCRIMDYNHLSKTFICTPEFSIVKESHFITKDLTISQPMNVTILNIKDEGLVVSSGHIRGFVPNLHISNVEYTHSLKKKYKEGQKLDARVLSIEEDKVLFTLKPSLIKNDNCLTKIENAEIGNKYPGVVAKITEHGALIVFYGNVKGWISQKGMGHENTDPMHYFFLGQVVSVYIWKVEGTHIYLSLFRPHVKSALPNVGGRYCGIVKSVREDGINIEIENSNRRGFVPNSHLSSRLSLCSSVKSSFVVGDKMPDLMYVGGIKPQIFSRRDALLMKTKKVPKLETLEVGNTIKCSYQSNAEKGIFVVPLIQDYTDPVLIAKEDLYHGKTVPNFVQYQSLVAKIDKLDRSKKVLKLSINFDDIFEGNVESVVNLFTQYISEISYLRQSGKKHKWDVCHYSPGNIVQCKVEKIGAEGGCVVSLPNGVNGITVPLLCPKSVKEGDIMSGTVISQDFDRKFVEICLRPDIAGRINSLQNGNLKSPVTFCMAEKLVVKDDCIIAVLKHPEANKQLVYLPTTIHENDIDGCTSYYENKKFKVCICGYGDRARTQDEGICLFKNKYPGLPPISQSTISKIEKQFREKGHVKKTTLHRQSALNEEVSKMKGYLIGFSKKLFIKLDKSTHGHKNTNSDLPVEKNGKKEIFNKPIKREQRQNSMNTGASSESDSGIEYNNEIEVDLDSESEDESQSQLASDPEVPSKSRSSDSNAVALPGVSSFFNSLKRKTEIVESSSEDEDTELIEKKKKKLSPAERAEILRQEEERISKIEKDLADANKAPESADQFDRLLVANPNSSELWTKYISFHIAATEIDKARTVARRALETINMNLQQEKFNIWIVLLNLENMFGTKESFDNVLEEALKYNDSLQIYLRVIEMFAENGKYSEMEEKIKKVRSKHKQDPTMWLEIGKAYYRINNFKEARNSKDSALKSITDKKTQMNLIVRFAIMEFKYGEEDQGCAIFETILTSDPKKVNIWSTYIDQLVKKERIDQARQVLERSVRQQLPLKNMKSLFMKFRKFEEAHGTPETLDVVKQRAQEYIAKFEK